MFRIHKSTFVQYSKFFRDLFRLGNVGLEREGEVEHIPLVIEVVTAEEFTDMLTIMFEP